MKEQNFVFYNIAPYSQGREKELAADMKEYVERTGNEIVLYSLTLNPQGYPAMEKANVYIDSYRKLKKELAGSKVKLGVLLQSLIGHWPRVDAKEEEWTRTVDINGRIVRYCPLDKDFRNYIFTIVQQLAKENPVFIMSDDDVRWFSPEAECFCALHTAEFNKRMKMNLSSEEYRKLVAECKPGDKIFKAYTQLQCDTVSGLGALIREAIDSVNPAIPTGACMASWGAQYSGKVAKAIAGKNPSVMRIANALYMEVSAKDVPWNVLRTQALKQFQDGKLDRILDESDTYPHHLYSRSSKNFHAKLCTSIMSGLRGAKVWYINAVKNDGTAVSKNYTDILAENSGLYQTLTKEMKNAVPTGVIIPLQQNFFEWHPVTPKEFFVERDSWGEIMCGAYGIPFRGSFDLKQKGVYAIAGAKSIEHFSDAELMQLLSGKLLLDGAAAEALTARGLSKYIGVKAEYKPFKYTIEADPVTKENLRGFTPGKMPLLTVTAPETEIMTNFYYEQWTGKGLDTVTAPATVFYKNSLGGYICTTANTVAWRLDHTLNEVRKKWFLRVLDKLSGSQIPYSIVGEQNLLALTAENKENETILTVLNLNFDKLKKLQIRCAKTPSSVELLGGDGVWRKQELNVENGVLTLPLSLECYELAVVKIN